MDETNTRSPRSCVEVTSDDSKPQLDKTLLADDVSTNYSESDDKNLTDLFGNNDNHVAPSVGKTSPDTDTANKCLMRSTPEVSKINEYEKAESKMVTKLKQANFHEACVCSDTDDASEDKGNDQSLLDTDKESVTNKGSENNVTTEEYYKRHEVTGRMCSPPVTCECESIYPDSYTLPPGGSTSTLATASSNMPALMLHPEQDASSTPTRPDTPSYNTAISFSLKPNAYITISELPYGCEHISTEGFLSCDNHNTGPKTNTAVKCIKLDIVVEREVTEIRQTLSDDALQTLPGHVTSSLPPDVILSDPADKVAKDTTLPLEIPTATTKFYLSEDEFQSSPEDSVSHTPSPMGESQILHKVDILGRQERKTTIKMEKPYTTNDQPTEVVFREHITMVQETKPLTETSVFRIINIHDNNKADGYTRDDSFTPTNPPTLPAQLGDKESLPRKETKIYKAETFLEVPMKFEELLGDYWIENTAQSLTDETTNVKRCATTEIYKDVKFELEIPAVADEPCQINEDNEKQNSPTDRMFPLDSVPVDGKNEKNSERNSTLLESLTNVGMNINRCQNLDAVSCVTQVKAAAKQQDLAATDRTLAAMKRLQMLIQGDDGQETIGNRRLLKATTNISKCDTQQSCIAGRHPHRSLGKHYPHRKKISPIKRLDMLIYD